MKLTIKSIIFATSCVIYSLGLDAQHIAAGGWHSLVICADSTVKAFGENASGQLGDGTIIDQSTPVQVVGLAGIKSVSAGGDQLEAHSMALKSDGTVWAWGSNLYGGLGNGTTINSMAPVQVLVINNIIKISAGGWHSVALKSDSTVWTWGWNTDGQIGDGTTVDKVVPTKVNSLSNIISIAAGTYHVLALKSDGTVWAWGDNVSGQIGNGTTLDQTTPTQVLGLTDVKAIAAGRFFSLAVKNDGTVWAWGENLYGQLGDGTQIDKSTPIQVSGLSGITSAVAATGAFHCMAVKSDNTVWSWGRNTYGNLGDGTTVLKSVPVQMTGMSDVVGLAAGTNFSLLYKTDSTFWACGRNASGQLGDGTVTQQNIASKSNVICPILGNATTQPSSIVDQSNTKMITIFPNPSNDGKFSIYNNNDLIVNNCLIEVYNSLGEKVYRSDLRNNKSYQSMEIDLSLHSNGIYFMSLKTESKTFYQKLVKQ